VLKLKLRRAICLLQNHTKTKEWEAAVQWYADKKSELKSKYTKAGQRIVNEEFLDDHISGQTDELSNSLSTMI
jgi:hypothetical protein